MLGALLALGAGVAVAWWWPGAAPGPVPAAAPTAIRLLRAPARTIPNWPGRLTRLAGDGIAGATDGPRARARFADPFGLVLDPAGAVYLSDGGDNNRIRKLGADGVVSTVAGAIEGFADGQGAAARFNTPSGIARDRAGNLYVADTGNNAIRKISPAGLVSTLAGDGRPGERDGPGRTARFNGPIGIALAKDGSLYVADTYNDRIRRVGMDGMVSTVAGSGVPGEADGPALVAQLDTPCALAFDGAGALWIADTNNDAIRKLGADGLLVTVARGDEHARDALMRRPMGLAITGDGYIYVSSGARGRVLQLAPDGAVLALSDSERPAAPGNGDGSVQLFQARGIALAPDGGLVLSDAGAMALYRLAPAALPALAPPGAAPELSLALAPMPLRTSPMLWPVKPQDRPHEVVGLMGEVRGNADGEQRDHLHAGLDVQAGVGSTVLTVEAGKVGNPLPNWGYGSASEGMHIGILSYIHMRVGRGPRDTPLDPRFQLLNDDSGKPGRVRVKRGTRFAAGEAIGSVNRMAHVHLDYHPGGAELNPLALPFIGLRDTTPPQIRSIALLDAAGRPLTATRQSRLLLPRALGEVAIVVDAYDQIDGDQARRRLGLYRLGYQLLRADGGAVAGYETPRITQSYDRLPRDREATKLAYADSSGITVHGAAATRFVYALTNRLADGVVAPGRWAVGALAPGDYLLRIVAADYAGNLAVKGRDLPLRVE